MKITCRLGSAWNNAFGKNSYTKIYNKSQQIVDLGGSAFGAMPAGYCALRVLHL